MCLPRILFTDWDGSFFRHVLVSWWTPWPGSGELGCAQWFLPGQPVISRRVSDQAQLGVDGDDQPGPVSVAAGSGRCGRTSQSRADPSRALLRELEGVLEVEPAQAHRPQAIVILSARIG